MIRNVSFLALALSLFTSLPSPVSAQQAERPFYIGGGGGAALELDRYPTQATLVQQLGWHFMGTTDGPFLELSVAESFGNDIITLQVAPRLGWDIALLRGDIGVMVGPSIAAGLVHAWVQVSTPFGSAGGSDSAFNLQGAFDVKVLLLDEQLEVFFRPVAIDVFIEDDVAARWNVLAGANYRF